MVAFAIYLTFFCHSYWKIPRHLRNPGRGILIGKHWRRAEFKRKQCVSKELLMVTAQADSMDGAQCEGVTPRAETEQRTTDRAGVPSKT